MKTKLKSGLMAIYVLFIFLLTKPIISIPEENVFGIPGLLVYLSIVWISLIVIMRLIFGRNQKTR